MPHPFTLCCNMSTVHLRPATKLWLDSRLSDIRSNPRPPLLHGAIHYYGWFLFVDEDPPKEWPEDVRDCMSWAHANSWEWIMFDEAGPIIYGLYRFDDVAVMPEPSKTLQDKAPFG